ncbi:MAG TPA: T9SS type A sorting domain-containing protein [Draconibacterium sp.]|nr:T9SS type A sorting domain-containing protein [Draconibacterium sp.]
MKKIILAIITLFIYFSAVAQQNKRYSDEWNNSFLKTEQIQPELKVYPNPCKDNKVTVEINNQELTEIKITTITGKQIYFKKLSIPENKKEIQLKEVPDGLYLIQIKTTENKLVAKKLMITSH